jgi:Uma2 family endonuclease
LSRELKPQPCEVYPSDMRVRVSATGLYTYPDVVVVCGEPRLEDDEQDTLLNPSLIIEVLSPSTESYDRGKKFEHYRTLESLVEYLLVAQDEPRVEQFVRQPGGTWLFTATSGRDAVVHLPSLGCSLALAEIYDKVPLP